LLQAYPIEAGKGERERILPYMPGPSTYVDETVTSERQVDLDQYCRDLLNLPRYLSECDLVQKQLFGIHEGDIELDYDPRVGDQSNANSSRSNVNSAHSNTNSSRSNVNSAHSNTNSSRSNVNSTHSSANSNHSNLDHFVNSNHMNRISSSLSTSSAVAPLPQPSVSQHPSQHQQQQQQIKIKIIHKDDIFAMKVPVDCSLDYLRTKVHERIGLNVKMEYKNEASGQNEPLEAELDMEEAFVQAIQRGKLTVTAIVMD
jgi:bud emergence protein 1